MMMMLAAYLRPHGEPLLSSNLHKQTTFHTFAITHTLHAQTMPLPVFSR